MSSTNKFQCEKIRTQLDRYLLYVNAPTRYESNLIITMQKIYPLLTNKAKHPFMQLLVVLINSFQDWAVTEYSMQVMNILIMYFIGHQNSKHANVCGFF